MPRYMSNAQYQEFIQHELSQANGNALELARVFERLANHVGAGEVKMWLHAEYPELSRQSSWEQFGRNLFGERFSYANFSSERAYLYFYPLPASSDETIDTLAMVVFPLDTHMEI